MSKRDLEAMASRLREVKPPADRTAELNGWAKAVVAVANAATATMGERFNRGRFYAAAGLSLPVTV